MKKEKKKTVPVTWIARAWNRIGKKGAEKEKYQQQPEKGKMGKISRENP